ncbi:hypothetical protein ABZX75_03370 [Streptomyces sp. NPDC003038]|uniref:hypothetical protein n=1 Tax=unclassified Streptomyces TaxID=2593676 RepID=UPI0033B7C6AA
MRCSAGYNRSGLVAAQRLVERGMAPDEAIALIRRRRSPRVPHNEVFASCLATGLDAPAPVAERDPLP